MDYLAKLINNVRTFDEGHITFDECLKTHSKICFNDIPSKYIDNFADGWSKDCTLNIFRLVCKVIDENDLESYERLQVDLGLIEPNMVIVAMDE